METDMIFLADRIRKEFSLNKKDIRNYSPLDLAFIGDCIYELIVRTYLIEKHNLSPHDLQVEAMKLVNAKTQAFVISEMEHMLSKDEADIYRRGRNAKTASVAKNASVSEYRHATGFEALLGYLYITGKEERLLETVKTAVDIYYNKKVYD